VSPLKKKLIVVGDRILVRPEMGEEKTTTGLYLPASAQSSRVAQGGWVVSVGPGLPMPDFGDYDAEHYDGDVPPPRYMPMQAQEGDYVLFMRKAGVEISFEGKDYLIIPNSSVLVLVREDWQEDRSQKN
jgi:chaperonin GroES